MADFSPDLFAGTKGQDARSTVQAQLIVAFDECIAECIRNHRTGGGQTLRDLGFTKTADELGM